MFLIIGKTVVVGLITGTIVANNDYACPRLQYCPVEASFPWYVPSFFQQNGSYEVKPFKFELRNLLSTINSTVYLVPANKYNFKTFPVNSLVSFVTLNEVLPGNLPYLLSNTVSGTFSENVPLSASDYLARKCTAAFAGIPIRNFSNPSQTFTCASITPAQLQNIEIVFTSFYRKNTFSVMMPNPNIMMLSNTTSFIYAGPVRQYANTHVIPPKEKDIFYFEQTTPTTNIPVVSANQVVDFNATHPSVRCDVSTSPVGLLLQSLFVIIKTAVNAYTSLANLFNQLGGNPESYIDPGQTALTLNEFEQLLFENQARPFCKIGLSNVLSLSPIIYAVIRATGCDNNSGEIAGLFFNDFFDDGLLGCTVAIINIFRTPDLTSTTQFILEVLLPVVLGDDLSGFIQLLLQMATCGTTPEVLNCLDNFGILFCITYRFAIVDNYYYF